MTAAGLLVADDALAMLVEPRRKFWPVGVTLTKPDFPMMLIEVQGSDGVWRATHTLTHEQVIALPVSPLHIKGPLMDFRCRGTVSVWDAPTDESYITLSLRA